MLGMSECIYVCMCIIITSHKTQKEVEENIGIDQTTNAHHY